MPDATPASLARAAVPRCPDRTNAIEVLARHADDLRALGVSSLAIFGSVARGDAQAGSDVDAAVRFDPAARKHGLAHLGQLTEIEAELARILGCPVDVIEEPAENSRLQRAIERDRVIVF